MTEQEQLSAAYSDLKEKHIALLGRYTAREEVVKAKNAEIQELLEKIEQLENNGGILIIPKTDSCTGNYVTLKKYQKQVKLTELYIEKFKFMESEVNRLKQIVC